MPALDLDGRTVPYALRRSRRARWMRAEFTPDAGLVVVLPEREDAGKVGDFLRRHRRWLERGLRRAARLAEWPAPTLDHGSTVPFLGRPLRLDLNRGPERVGRLGDALIVHVPRRTRAATRAALKSWYAAEAVRELGERARALAARLGLSFRKLAVRDQKRRWGSCSSAGTLSFNWRLLLMPEDVADYLVAHEVAHLAVPDHSARFWSKVAEACPAWRERERWLKRLGAAVRL
ncbi:MAG TPA: SprT family zinc-dependent metalloprotease [Planctomycetota bacterium]